jgi:hypothetical protein
MKLKLVLMAGLALAGANAMACYTVFDAGNRVIYQGERAPVDMSMPLREALAARRFPAGSSMVFNQSASCTPVAIAQVARSNVATPPSNTIRMESTGRQLSPNSDASPLLTDRATAQRHSLPHTTVAGDIVLVPASVAARIDLPTFTVIPADTALARAPVGPDTTAMGNAPARRGQTVITEMRDPSRNTIERNGTIQRY